MTAYDDMSAGKLYDAGHPDLVERRKQAQRLMARYNSTVYGDDRTKLLTDLLGTPSEAVIRPPFYVDYGTNIHFEEGCFLNYGCVFLDVCPIHIGQGTQIGPMCQLLTADHPRDPKTRSSGLEMGQPITVGKNVWMGGGVIILPGVTVGDNAILGAGAIITKDVPAGATMVSPAAKQLP